MKLLIICTFFLAFNSLAGEHFPFANGTLNIPYLGERESLICTGCQKELPQFIQNKFNRPGDFHGPNCYNTSLIASGLFKTNQIRYVSPEEFKAIIQTHYQKLNSAKADSLVVFDAKSSWGHSGFYLGDGLVFHKKSYATHYHYRITPIGKVGVIEKNEWTPNPFEGSLAQFDWPELGKLPMDFYQLSKRSLNYSNHAQLLKYIESIIIKDAGSWAFAKNWGLVGLNLLQELMSKLPNQDALTKGMLISFKDQVQVYFDEVHFKNTRNYDRTTEEVCLPANLIQLQALYKDLGKYLKVDSQILEKKWNQVLNQDKRRCREKLSF